MRDYQRQRLYDFEDEFFYRKDELSWSPTEIDTWVCQIWEEFDLDKYLRPKVKLLTWRARSNGAYRIWKIQDRAEVRFHPKYLSKIPHSLMLHEVAHAIHYAKFGDEMMGDSDHGDVFCRIYFEMQVLFSNHNLGAILAWAKSCGLSVWEYQTLFTKEVA